DVFDERVGPVDLVGGHGVALGGRGGGEERVEAPQVEESLLALVLLRVQLRDAAHHQTAGDLFAGLLGGEGGIGDLGDLGPGDPPAGLLVVDRIGVLDRLPRIVADGGNRALDGRVQPYRDG